jgi:hypothetical protein
MKPKSLMLSETILRRQFLALGLTSLGSGCSSLMVTEEPDANLDALLADTTTEESGTTLVRNVALAWGLNWLKIEAVALVNGLNNTGSNPPAGPQRQALVDEMQTHRVPNPNELLASPATSLVLLRATLPPGIRKEDRFDVEVMIPRRSETTSLRGGWLMLSRMRQLEELGGVARQGHVIGLAEGNVIIESAFTDGNDKVLENRGWVLGGGKSHLTRTLGLTMRNDHRSIKTSTLVGAAINARFQLLDHGKKGVANPKREDFIELAVHPTYRHNIPRYLQVIRSIAINEKPQQRADRLRDLEVKLNEPTMAYKSALQLEAIGREAIPILKRGMESADPEVRFNSAEALAYLDDDAAAAELGRAAKSNPAFRSAALAALSNMKHINAFDALSDLLHVASAETRYGAFRALRTRNYLDPIVRGTVLGDDAFSFHVVSTSGEPLIHFTRTQRPEVVIFGTDQRMKPPPYLLGKSEILIKGVDDEHVRVSRFRPGKEDQQVVCSNLLADIIPAIVQVGGGYVEVLQIIRAAKKEGYLEGRVAVEALPREGREYYRDEDKLESSNDQSSGDDADDSLSKNDSNNDRNITNNSRNASALGARRGLIQEDSQRLAPEDFNKQAKPTWWQSMTRWLTPAE